MAIQKLDAKPSEYCLVKAGQELACDSCNKIIPEGNPYLIRRKVIMVDGNFALSETIDCLVPCSSHRECIRAASDVAEGVPLYQSPRRPLVYAECWRDKPMVATAKELENLKIILSRSGRWVATGYTRIVEAGPFRFLECDPSQIMKGVFTRHFEGDDTYGKYVSWREPDGFFCRLYSEDSWQMKAGYWYLGLQFLEIAPSLQLATALTRACQAAG